MYVSSENYLWEVKFVGNLVGVKPFVRWPTNWNWL